jgi:ELWxxDGT repeat protein
LFFIANDGEHGFELWKSDGTEAGTVMVKDIVPGLASSNPRLPSSDLNAPPPVLAAAAPGVFVFTTNGEKELWRSDGTEAGTYLLKTAGPPSPNSPFFDPQAFDALRASNGAVYFSVSDPTIGRELWRTDGTVAGTTLVKDLFPGPQSSFPLVAPGADGETFVNAMTGGTSQNPVRGGFVTDGTPAGTQLLLPGEQFASVQPFNGLTYFVPRKANGDATEVFRTDGTPEGTTKVLTFDAHPAGDPMRTSAAVLGVFRGKLLLSGYSASTSTTAGGDKFYVSDGTAAGTTPLAVPQPGAAANLKIINDLLYYSDGVTNAYRSDGTPAGTVLLKNTAPAGISSFGNPNTFIFVPVGGGKVVFTAPTQDSIFWFNPNRPDGFIRMALHDLFATDGTPEGTQKLETVPQISGMMPMTNSSMYTNFVNSGGTFYFGAVGPDQQSGLWKTDGTAAGTVVVTNAVHDVSRLTDLHGTLVFLGVDSAGVSGLYRSDGTAAGTVRIAEMPAPNVDDFTFLHNLRAVVGDTLYFVNGADLWKTDGSAAGTSLVRSFETPADSNTGATYLTAVGDKLFFYANTADKGWELWKSDGTPAGTVMVKDVNPGAASSMQSNDPVAVLNGVLYFAAVDEANGRQVWKSDGTEAGTFRVPGQQALPPIGYQDEFAAVGNWVYYRQFDGTTWKLWRTDGTAAGTVMVHPELTLPNAPFVKDGKLLFSAQPAPNGAHRLYSLDPQTNALTQLLDNFEVHLDSREPPAVLNRTVYFETRGNVEGTRVAWTVATDGTPAGTRVAGYRPLVIETSYAWPAVAGDNVLLAGASAPRYGAEPWLLVADAAAPRTATVAGRHVFYDNSYHDSFHPGGDAKDDPAVATDKAALLPGQAASFANVTSYSRGLNGVMVDIANLPAGGALSADDFIFRSGAGPSPAGLAAGPSAPQVVVRRGRGDGGSDRVDLVWPDGAIKNKWLQVTVKANDHTGLAKPDVFYFGNLAGETGDSLSPLRISSGDLAAIRRNLTAAVPPVTSRYDVNRDGKINALDLGIIRANLFRQLIPMVPPDGSATAFVAAEADVAAAATSLLREG